MRLFLLLFLIIIDLASSHNILVYINAIGKSHLDFCDSLINSLTDRGHVVDYIIARMNDKVAGNGKNNASRVYTFGFKGGSDWKKTAHLIDPFKDSNFDFGGFRQYSNVGNNLCEIALDDTGLHEFIKFRKYQIGLVSTFDYCGIGLFVNAGVPSIATFNAVPILSQQAILAGLPSPASNIVPLFHRANLRTFSGRFWNLANWAYINYVQIPEIREQQQKIFAKRYGENYDIDSVAARVDLSFINSNEVMEKPRPISHRIQYIGGINLRSPKPIDKNLDKLLSISKKGTIIFSFGTQVGGEVYPRYAVKNFVKVFKKYSDYTFLWKYDVQESEVEMFKNAKNVYPLDWLPQTDLLYDPRVIGFISHVGLNSFNEASYAGVPIVAIPLFADQPHNAENGLLRGTTYILDKTKLSEQSIEAGIKAILEDPKYLENALRLRKMLIEKPGQPKDRFVNWVEYAAENPGLHKIFELPGSRMGIIEYYCVDALVFTAIVVILVIYLVFKIFKNLFVAKTKKDKTS
ncbi:unnamed protein product [Caenorhabditis angaria]|uniref:glucuronosyltransferase n=1 Tax=Caenorhabditis angaria TaxID=860376 RepID=A0A9P1IWE7_9PELO|nr:unnamed protein product [Caenorhabditis angaria]